MLQDVRCHFGSVRAVDGVNLAIAPGEFFTLLRALGVGQDDLPAHDRRLRAAHRPGAS